MRSGPFLLKTGIEQHRPLGLAGEPVYLNHRKLVTVVASRLGASAASYFARPEVDETNHHINWHATVDGDVRRWSSLSPEEQANLAPKLAALQQGLASLAATLERAGTQGEAQENFGRALRLALSHPGVENLYMVGDQPVMTLWGFEGGSHRFDAVTFSPTPSPTRSAVDLPPNQAAAPARRSWWRWLLWLLGLLALLLLTLLVLRSCLDVPIPVVDELLPPKDSAPAVEPSPETPIIEPGITVVPGGPIIEGDGVGAEVAPEGEIPALPSETAPPTGEAPPPADSTPETPPAEPTDDAPLPEESPSDATPPEPPAEEPPPPPGADGAEQAEPLTIPPPEAPGNGQDLGFLEGQWRSDGGLYDKSTGKPLTQFYRFDGDGKGSVVIRRADGVECSGDARATRTETGSLRIEEAGPIECPDGKRFAPAVTECSREENGQAKCQGTNRAGSNYNVEITR